MAICISRLKSSQIIADCQRSLDLLDTVPDGDKQLFRIYWTFCLVALRRVKNALEKYDVVAFPKIRSLYEQRKSELFALKELYRKDTPFAECPLDYLIYHRLIHGERNVVVHEVEQTYSDSWTFLGSDGSFDLGDIYLPMGDIDLWGDWDCRDWIQQGIDWWKSEIKALIAKSSDSGKRVLTDGRAHDRWI